jgi:Phage tail assembly chaperone
MAKIKLGSAPKAFTHKVTFPLLQGGTGEITITYRYRDRTQFAEFIDSVYPKIKKPDPVSKDAGFDVIQNALEAQENEVRYIMGAATAWDLEDDLSEANVRALINEFPAAGAAITAAYREAITEGRAKN